MSECNLSTKRCGHCKATLPVTGFYRSKARGDGLAGICKRCQEEAKKRWRAKRPGYEKERREADPEGYKARQARYYKNNTEKVKEKSRKHYEKNKESSRKRSREWFAANREYAAAQARQVYKDDPQAVLAKNRRRKALRLNAPGKHTGEDICRMYQDQDGLCAYCEVSLLDTYEVDHMIPLSRNGTNDADNIALSCMPCNRSKGNKTAEEFWCLMNGDT